MKWTAKSLTPPCRPLPRAAYPLEVCADLLGADAVAIIFDDNAVYPIRRVSQQCDGDIVCIAIQCVPDKLCHSPNWITFVRECCDVVVSRLEVDPCHGASMPAGYDSA